MAKSKPKKKHIALQHGYSDGKPRRKSVKKRAESPYWQIHYTDADLKRQRISSNREDETEAIEVMLNFSPFDPETYPNRDRHKDKPKHEVKPVQGDSSLDHEADSSVEGETKNATIPVVQGETTRGAIERTMEALEKGLLTGITLDRYRPSTLRNFRYTGLRFARYCEEQGEFTHIADWKAGKSFQDFFDGYLDTKSGVSIQTLRNYRRDLSVIAELMMEHEIIESNPFKYRSKKLKKTQAEKSKEENHFEIFTPEEFAEVLRAIDRAIEKEWAVNPHSKVFSNERTRMLNDVKDYAIFAYFTGERLSEIRHTDWSDVDFQKQTVRVSAKEDWAPKTQSSLRTIPISGKLMLDMLKRRYERYLDWSDRENSSKLGERVFLMLGQPEGLSKDYISHTFKKFVREAFSKDDPRRFHSLRHSYISIQINDNEIDPVKVMDLAGHSNLAQTLKYRHRSRELEKAEKLRIDVDYSTDTSQPIYRRDDEDEL